MTEYPIDSYAVYVISGEHKSLIHFSEADTYRGTIRFFSDENEIEDASMDSDGKIILNMHFNHFHSMLDIIRNEKPLFIFYESPSNAGIRTGSEKIGDDQIWLT